MQEGFSTVWILNSEDGPSTTLKDWSHSISANPHLRRVLWIYKEIYVNMYIEVGRESGERGERGLNGILSRDECFLKVL